jgi:hypothetical protein
MRCPGHSFAATGRLVTRARAEHNPGVSPAEPFRRGACLVTWIAILLHGLSPGVTSLSGWSVLVPQSLQPMPYVTRSIIEENAAPAWLRLPPHAELKVPSGVRLEVSSTSIVSHEGRKEAALVGLFLDVGRRLSGAELSLSFIGRDGVSVVSSSSNGATVSEVSTNGFLPFRFPLVRTSLLSTDVAVLRLSLAERAVKARRSVPATLVRYSVKGTANEGTLVAGEIDLAPTEDQGPGEALVMTILLLDKDRRCLDVLAGEPTRLTANSYRFWLRGPMPVARNTRAVQVWVEAYSR